MEYKALWLECLVAINAVATLDGRLAAAMMTEGDVIKLVMARINGTAKGDNNELVSGDGVRVLTRTFTPDLTLELSLPVAQTLTLIFFPNLNLNG